MTEEQRKYKEEQYRLRNGYLVTIGHVKKFLEENGYKWQGFYLDETAFSANYIIRCYDDENIPMVKIHADYILIGAEDEWIDKAKYGYMNILDNPFVKYISPDFTTFKIEYPVVNEAAVGGWGVSDEPYFIYELEKDLSDKWIRFLTINVPEYKAFIQKELEFSKKSCYDEINRS
ncbi:MAG: hypothetical protein IJX26_02920, partial [Clostridia bacterium]|nr:hypothetical protein [Clostridia bacterium]